MGVDTDDLRARARSHELASLTGKSSSARLLFAAADEIDALRAEVERLRVVHDAADAAMFFLNHIVEDMAFSEEARSAVDKLLWAIHDVEQAKLYAAHGQSVVRMSKHPKESPCKP